VGVVKGGREGDGFRFESAEGRRRERRRGRKELSKEKSLSRWSSNSTHAEMR
jgi:hypothetical protein